VERLVADLRRRHPFLPQAGALRLVRAYGTEAAEVLGDARAATDLGRDFGAGLTAREVEWLMRKEYARTAEDVLWRRTKLGLRLTADEARALDAWMAERRRTTPAAAE
jgi:glycerol-3-phosphate dehydrogenase